MKNIIKIFVWCLFVSITSKINAQIANNNVEVEKVNKVLDAWHIAAAQANFEAYFSYMSHDGVFLGTDATENWQNKAFREFSKPYFDKGKAWSFSAIERNIYIDDSKQFAWFDELLDTQMKICRGSGVLQKMDNQWKIKHYVLSITIPNENVEEVVNLKRVFDNNLEKELKGINKNTVDN